MRFLSEDCKGFVRRSCSAAGKIFFEPLRKHIANAALVINDEDAPVGWFFLGFRVNLRKGLNLRGQITRWHKRLWLEKGTHVMKGYPGDLGGSFKAENGTLGVLLIRQPNPEKLRER